MSYGDSDSLRSAVRFALDEFDLFVDKYGTPYATYLKENVVTTLKIQSVQFQDATRKLIIKNMKSFANMSVVKDVVEHCASFARDQGKVEDVYVRYAPILDSVCVDCADGSNRIIRIDRDGITIENNKIRFFRPQGMERLVVPIGNMGVPMLRVIIPNLSDDDYKLVWIWMAYAIYGKGPYPILAINGVDEAAVIFLTKIICDLIDPGRKPQGNLPRSRKEFAVNASNNRLLVYDHIDHLKKWQSNTLCGIATGSSYRGLRQRSDYEEIMLAYCRPVLLSGTSDLIEKSDLAARTVSVEVFNNTEYRDDNDWYKLYLSAKPFILNDLYRIVGEALKKRTQILRHTTLPGIKIGDKVPLMREFCKFACDVASILKWEPTDFLRVYNGKLYDQLVTCRDSDPLIGLIVKFLRVVGQWIGTATKLLDALTDFAKDHEIDISRYWPDNATCLGNRIRNGRDIFEKEGITYRYKRKANDRLHIFKSESIQCSVSLPEVPQAITDGGRKLRLRDFRS